MVETTETETETLDPIEMHRQRVRRRTAFVDGMIAHAAAGERPQTPRLTAEQIDMHGEHLVALLRLFVQTWAACTKYDAPIPQPLSVVAMASKAAIQGATASLEVADA